MKCSRRKKEDANASNDGHVLSFPDLAGMKAELEEGDLRSKKLHVGIIMDGSGTWAKQNGLRQRWEGHKKAIDRVKELVQFGADVGLAQLSLFAFGIDNFKRSKEEVSELMRLFRKWLEDPETLESLSKNHARLKIVGDWRNFERFKGHMDEKQHASLRHVIERVVGESEENVAEEAVKMRLNILFVYSHTWEIKQAQGDFDKLEIPYNVDLMIRTKGNDAKRLSDFMCSQCRYAEMIFEPALFPDFRDEHFANALLTFGCRSRNFGVESKDTKPGSTGGWASASKVGERDVSSPSSVSQVGTWLTKWILS